MRIFYLLMKRQLLAITGVQKLFYGNLKEKKVFRRIFFAAAAAGIVLFLYWSKIFLSICMVFPSAQEILNYLLRPFAAVSVLMIFLSALVKGSGVLYADKNIELLFSYPVKTKTVVLSKLALVYLWNLCISFALLVLPVFRYEKLQGASGIFCIVDFVQIAVLPVVPTLLGMILGRGLYGWLGKLCQSGASSKSVVYLILFTVFLAFALFFFANGEVTALYETVTAKPDFFNRTEKGILFSHSYKSLLFLTASILTGILLTGYISEHYKKDCVEMQLCSGRRKHGKIRYKKHKRFVSLFIREWKRYFSMPVYVLNTMLGIVSLILLTIYFCVKTDVADRCLRLVGQSFEMRDTPVLLAFAVSLLIILSNVTYASISVEAKQRELLKAYPISVRELLLAKYFFHLSLTAPVIFICTLLLGMTFSMSGVERALLFLLPGACSAFAGALGLLINLIFPNYEWENAAYIVKQSLAAILTIFLSVLAVGGALWGLIRFFNTQIVPASYGLAVLFILLTTGIVGLWRKAEKAF